MLLSKRLPPRERRHVVARALSACSKDGVYPSQVVIPKPFNISDYKTFANAEMGPIAHYELAHQVVAEAMVGLEDRVRAFLTLLRQVDSLAQEPCNFCGGGYMMRDLLESRGFRFHIKPTGWTVFFGERQVGHGECSPDQRGLHYAHARASRRAALEDAIRCARRVRL